MGRRQSGNRRRDEKQAVARLQRGRFTDPMQLAAFFWGRVTQLWDLDTVTFGMEEPLRAEELLGLNLHVRATGQRELSDGYAEQVGCAYALGRRGPRLGTAVTP